MSSNTYTVQSGNDNQGHEGAVEVTPVKKSSRRSRKAVGAFRTISEVANELDVQQHVLRFWETKFSQIRPLKRGGGRRYYRPEDIELLKSIHHLLYTEGYTIKGVQKLLREQGKAQVLDGAGRTSTHVPDAANAVSIEETKETSSQVANESAESQNHKSTADRLTPNQRRVLASMLAELKDLRDMIGD